MPLGPEHKVILKGRKVAQLHCAVKGARALGNDYHPYLEKMGLALDELEEAVRDWEEWKAGNAN
jgi:hypothetical protein